MADFELNLSGAGLRGLAVRFYRGSGGEFAIDPRAWRTPAGRVARARPLEAHSGAELCAGRRNPGADTGSHLVSEAGWAKDDTPRDFCQLPGRSPSMPDIVAKFL